MKTLLISVAVALAFVGVGQAQEPLAQSKAEPGVTMPSKLGSPAHLKHYEVTIRRFDPKKGLESGDSFVLPVNCIDEEHAITSTMDNLVACTKKSEGTEILSVAFCCVGIEEKK